MIAWHLMDPPRTAAAFAAALPLQGLDAWRVYLELPLCGSRLPAGGAEELMRLGYQDAVLNLHEPITTRGAEEFPAALAELRDQLGLGPGPLGLVGGSIGAAVAQLVLVEAAPAAGVPVHPAVLVSPVTRLRPIVDALGRRFGVDYPWSDRTREVAHRLDFAARSDEFARARQPAVRLVVGSDDDPEGFLAPAQQLRAALADAYDDAGDVDLLVVPDMAHALAEEPGDEPVPQTRPAATLDQYAVDWLAAHLPAVDIS
ncbi:MAG: alpha/beta hydrolase [Actinomycetota bacterium]|nr:alpha/beta hydrolase [Actinomycetota bacterium]